MSTEDVKSLLLAGPWRKAGTLEVEGADGSKVELIIRRPPPKAALDFTKEARKLGLVDEQGEQISDEKGLEFAARMFAPMVYLPGAVRPLFTWEELLNAPFFMELSEACKAAISPVKEQVEAAKGN